MSLHVHSHHAAHQGEHAYRKFLQSDVIYTCPMHPQIRQDRPGNCPICGMTLEPVTATADVGENHELVDMTRRFWIGLVSDLAGLRPGNGRPHSRSWPA